MTRGAPPAAHGEPPIGSGRGWRLGEPELDQHRHGVVVELAPADPVTLDAEELAEREIQRLAGRVRGSELPVVHAAPAELPDRDAARVVAPGVVGCGRPTCR